MTYPTAQFNIGGHLAQATADARYRRIPYNPLRPHEVIEHAGEAYALTWLELEFDRLSPTGTSEVAITRRSTGQRVEIGRVWRKERISKKGEKTLAYTVKGVGHWRSYPEACAGLVALAAERMNPKGAAA